MAIFIEATEREHLHCGQVIEQAKGRWLDILYLFAAGLDPQEVADRLHISKKTVDTYKTPLLKLCRIAWNMQLGEHLDYHFLHEKFVWLANGSDEEADKEECTCCRQVTAQAKKRWLDVLYLLAAGLHPQEVADQLGVSRKTVNTYNSYLLDLCRTAWNMQPGKHLDYHFLHEKFARHFKNSM